MSACLGLSLLAPGQQLALSCQTCKWPHGRIRFVTRVYACTCRDHQLKRTKHLLGLTSNSNSANADPFLGHIVPEKRGGGQAWYAYLVADPNTRAMVDELSPPELSSVA